MLSRLVTIPKMRLRQEWNDSVCEQVWYSASHVRANWYKYLSSGLPLLNGWPHHYFLVIVWRLNLKNTELCSLIKLLFFVLPRYYVSYLEKKKVDGKDYFYLSNNVRISGNKWKKYRKYIGTDLSNLGLAEKELEQVMPIKRLLTYKQINVIELLKENYSKTHKIKKGFWKAEKEQIVSFIYNTNAIEGNSLSYEETKAVLEGKKLTVKKAKRDVCEVENMKNCIEFLFDYDGPIHLELILKVHAMELKDVHAEAGHIRIHQNMVGNYLPPKPESVPGELDQFFLWFNRAEKVLHPLELAALTHLKFVRIHPFMEGNGRLSRLLMNYVLLKNNYPLLNIFNAEKMLYYLALKEVDFKKKERPFVKYLYQVYINQYKKVILKPD